MAQTTFTPPHLLKTPVLFMVFNRLDPTKQVFEAIRQAQPPRLYVAADGPIESRDGEAEKVQAVREHVMKNIDWDCEIKTLFREKNLGCKYAVSSAITWFFENEEMGIILEDDCLPSQSFFWFCEELLEKYRDDMRISHIGGVNFQKEQINAYDTYYFSIYNHVWGWASWANRWKFYDVELNSIIKDDFIKNIFEEKGFYNYWKKIFYNVKKRKINSWAYSWTFTMWFNNGLSILPTINMVSNIGFGTDATHTKNWYSKSANRPNFNVDLNNIVHPKIIESSFEADRFSFNNHFKPDIFNSISNLLKKMLAF